MIIAKSPEKEFFNACFELIDRNIIDNYGNKTAIYFEDKAYTYNQLRVIINKTVNFIKSKGIKKKDRILLISEDSLEFVVCFLALLKAGCMAILLSPDLQIKEYSFIINSCRPKLILLSGSARKIPRGSLKSEIVTISKEESTEYFLNLIKNESEEAEYEQTRRKDDCLLLYTSGTTGLPKGFFHNHFDLCLDNFPKGVLNINAKDTILSTSKLPFSYGLGNSLLFPFGAGAASVLFRGPPQPYIISKLAKRYRPTLFFSTPSIYSTILNFRHINKIPFESVNLFISSGEHLSEQIIYRWGKIYHKEILNVMGATEFCHVFLSSRPGEDGIGSCGLPVKGFKARVVDKKGSSVRRGNLGNLIIKGPTLAKRSLSGNKIKIFNRPWFKTGDLAMQNKKGYFYIYGRQGDAFKINGRWVCTSEIEEAINRNQKVSSSAVTYFFDKDGLAKIKSFVVLKNPRLKNNFTKLELKKFLLSHLSVYKCPQVIEFVDYIPKTRSGKIQRYKLRCLGPA